MSEPVADARGRSAWSPRKKLVARIGFVVIFAVYWPLIGLPTDTLQIMLWLWAATIAWNAGAPWRSHLQFARDWGWIALVLIAYSFTRGLADNLGIAVHVTEPIRADAWMTGGELPTYWLQHHLCAQLCTQDTPAHWYDVIASTVYFSHFVTSLVVAMVLWLRSRSAWKAFMARFLALTLLGLVIYIAYPMAPPWWAAEHGYLAEPIPRILHRGWDLIGLHGAGKIIGAAEAQSNPVAAMPSMHTAIATFVALFGVRRLRSRVRFLLLLYPLVMGAALIYLGEHYLVDVLAGYACAVLVLVVAAAIDRRRARRADRPVAHDTPFSGSDVEKMSGDASPPDQPSPAGGARSDPGGRGSGDDRSIRATNDT